MKTVILCGGQGTRIRDVAADVPKPMIAIGRLPILWHLMRYYAHFGHNEFVLCLGYKGEVIKDFFLNYRAQTRNFTIDLGRDDGITYHSQDTDVNWKVTLVDTGLDTMTGARVKRIQEFVSDEPFMLTYGDGLSNIDLDALVAFHRQHGRTATVTGVRPPGRFGELRVGADGVASEFNEKPQATGGRISGGFFVLEPSIFRYLDDREDLVFEQEPIRGLVGDKQLSVFEHDDFWQCMDTHRDWSLLNALAESESQPWKRW
jgi:glucose-1-phosphate cytidylyltransferase